MANKPTRPLTYRIGQLLAIAEFGTRREHDTLLMQRACRHPDTLTAEFASVVTEWPGPLQRRWQAVMGTMEDVPSGAFDAAGETYVRLGHWHECTQISRSIRVQDARQQLGMSQTDWAQALGVSVKTVQAWEQGVNNVPEEIEEHGRLIRERTVNEAKRRPDASQA
ncbi:helix-turn-helix domain-containing protein [Deinococcus daejeonensis]|uniref:HTH cro/C1-type domain-containing protein n=1 Tax=Deinococcus daejeonensis TaxID=1007098 RepID=A0ABQ2JGH0_9DEIO|nr:helix-turn-helix domain-containing protein [Deinococcus daejeonensis]GGN45336.1 hypothetical protein GCM10010842_34780 [Deinococcus daejeonensis]